MKKGIIIITVIMLVVGIFLLTNKAYAEDKAIDERTESKIVEIKEQNQLQNPVAIVQKEGVDIVKNLKGYVILCDIKGKELSSEKLSEKIKSIMMLSSTITIVVGGSYGVSEEVKKLADEKISFSPMTFPHNLFRIMLLEQIYRAFTIIENKSYHK